MLTTCLNHRFWRLPTTVALIFASVGVSLLTLLANRPGFAWSQQAQSSVQEINFGEAFLNGTRSFLLYAGSLHVPLDELRVHRRPVAILATVGCCSKRTKLVGADNPWSNDARDARIKPKQSYFIPDFWKPVCSRDEQNRRACRQSHTLQGRSGIEQRRPPSGCDPIGASARAKDGVTSAAYDLEHHRLCELRANGFGWQTFHCQRPPPYRGRRCFKAPVCHSKRRLSKSKKHSDKPSPSARPRGGRTSTAGVSSLARYTGKSDLL